MLLKFVMAIENSYDAIVWFVRTNFIYLTLAIAITTSISIWLYNLYTFWSSQNMPGPRPLLIVGNMLDFASSKKSWIEVDCERVRKYGRLYGTYNALERILNIADPSVIKKVLVSDFYIFHGRRRFNHQLLKQALISKNGKDWKDTRAVMSPSFTSGKMKQMMPLLYECVDSFYEALDQIIASGQNKYVDIKSQYSTFTINVVAKCAFGVDANAHRESENLFIHHARRFLQFNKVKVILFLTLPNFVKDMLNFKANPTVSFDFIAKTAREIVRQRRVAKIRRTYPDLLQLLMDASAEDNNDDSTPDHEAHHGLEDIATNKLSTSEKKILTEDEIVANTMIILGAGFETTSFTLSYASYSLALNQNIQDKLRAEVMEAVNRNGGQRLSYETITGLKYLDAVVCETLRMYPPATRAERKAIEDYILETDDSKLFEIPEGTIIHIPLYAIHHDPNFFKDPETFDPERFLGDRKNEIIPYTYIPFTAGPRNCIGMRFALLVVKICLIEMIRRYRFVKSDKTDVPLDFSGSTIFLKAKNIIAGLEKV